MLLLVPATCLAQKVPAAERYVGARVCQRCHPQQFEIQSRSGHAAALSRAAEHPMQSSFPADFIAYRAPEYRLVWKQMDDGFRAIVHDGNQTVEQRVEWAFGAGDQAVTFVSQLDEDRYVEHHLSYYSASGALAATPGHRNTRAANPQEAFGVLYPTFAPDSSILRCFQCHSTGPLSIDDAMRIAPFEAGVRCESCHGPGSRHATAATRATIFNPKRIGAAALNNFCGRCHRPPASDPSAIDWGDAWNVRHQPVFLSQSACFVKSNKLAPLDRRQGAALNCLTCHAAHGPLRRNDASWYNSRCATCHTAASHPPAAVCTAGSGRPSGCADCHMPKFRPQPNLQFTNHWIGVFFGRAGLRPRPFSAP